MEKPGTDKTITIKINGKDRSLYEQNKSARPEQREVQNPYDDLEAITSWETAAGQELKDDDDFEWILPELEEEEDIKEFKIASTKKGKKTSGVYQVFSSTPKNSAKRTIIPSILLTIFLAVLFGSSLGIMLLKMVISDKAVEVDTTPAVEEKPSTEENNPPGALSIEMPVLTTFVVQGGAFSSMEAANTEEASFTGRGIPAKALEMDGNNYLFVGIADNLDNAKTVGALLKEKGIDTFAKEVSFGGGTVGELHESEQMLLEQAPTLFQTLTRMTTIANLSGSISPELTESFNNEIKKWHAVENLQMEEIQQLKIEMDKAGENMKSYLESNDASRLLTIEQHLLNFLALYEGL